MTSGALILHRRATFAPELSSAGAARRLLAAALDEADRTDWGPAGTLALSEVATNAVLHGHTVFEVVVEVYEDRLRVEVHDSNPALPLQPALDRASTTGRGMALVAALTDECGVHSRGADGKSVWFCLSGAVAELAPEDLLDTWDLDGDWEQLEGPPTATRTVRLEGMPIRLWLVARHHHEALLRELVLYLAEHDDVSADLVLAGAARGHVSPTAARVAQRRLDLAAGADRSATEQPLDVVVPADAGAAYAALQAALEVAEGLARAGRLLVRPGLPEVVALRDWGCGEVVAQLSGHAPSPWPGAALARFLDESLPTPDDDAPWDDTEVRRSTDARMATDEADRIITASPPLAALLGWRPGDLDGRRVVVLVPERLREAHVASVTRQLISGDARLLSSTPIVMPVLRADGTERLFRVVVDRAPATSRRSVYLSTFTPLDPGQTTGGATTGTPEAPRA